MKSTKENITFDKLCMEGDLSKIEEFAKLNSEKINFMGNHNIIPSLLYRLAEKNSIEVFKFLFESKHIKGIPGIISINYGDESSVIELLYRNGNKPFIQYLLTNKNIKDSIKFWGNFVSSSTNGSMIVGTNSYFFELLLKEKDWNFADYLINSPDIKYPITKDFNILINAFHRLNDLIDNEFLSKSLTICRSFFSEKEQFSAFCALAKNKELPIKYELKIVILDKLINLNLIDQVLILNKIDEESKDLNWINENQSVINLSKYLLMNQIDKELDKKDYIQKLNKIKI